MVVAALVMLTWIVALATSLRHRAWTSILGQPIPEVAVNLGKAFAIAAVIVLVAAVMGAYAQRLGRVRLGPVPWLIAKLAAGVAVAASFFLLYTYIGALINLRASTGVIFVVTLLLWVNIVVRAYFVGLCSMMVLRV